MYWYYKYSLLLVIAALTGGAVYWGWHACGVSKGHPERLACSPNPAPHLPSVEMKMVAPPTVPRLPKPILPSPVAETSSGPTTSMAPVVPSEFPQKMKLAEDTYARGNLAMARGMIENIMKLPEIKPYEAKWFQAADLLGKINTTLVTTTAPAPEKIRYEVKSGDTLIGIRNKFQTTIE